MPVLCGSALKNKGVQPLLDAIIDYLPSPLDVEAVEGHAVADEDEVLTRRPADDEPFSALAFKIVTDPHVGRLTFIRVYSGVLNSGDTVYSDGPIPAEVKLPDGVHMTVSGGSYALRRELCGDSFLAKDGWISATDEPGLGIQINEAIFEKYYPKWM